jgi:hypothetical protein
MNVIFISPGYPPEMPHFVRGLAEQGANVIGVSDVPHEQIPEHARRHLARYLRVPSLTDEPRAVAAVQEHLAGGTIDRVVCLWEPGVVLAAKLRAALGVPGQSVEHAIAFRDKDVMKQVIRNAGLRTARSARATTMAEVQAACQQFGFPVVVKPIDGAGSMDTFKISSAEELPGAIERLRHVPIVNVEEFIDGEEYHFDTICANGEILYYHMGYYRPKPIISRHAEWISPQTLSLRDLDAPFLQAGIELGKAVLKAMSFETGFTHMEWFLTSKGEAIFSEIAARPPGANTVDLMNYGSDIDVFSGYAEAEVKGTFSQKVVRKYNAINIFKRAQGQGRITRIEGMAGLMQRYGEYIVHVDLLPVGAMRRNWVQTLLSDGYVVIRHPDYAKACEIADAFGTDLQLYAGG